MQDHHRSLRGLPQVERVMQAAAGLVARHGRPAVLGAVRMALDEARRAVRAGGAVPDGDRILAGVAAVLEAQPALRRVINASGIVLHTNLGRAPLASEAIAAVADMAAGYGNLEYDLATGRRGSRTAAIEPLLRDLAGAEAALAVNNGAAAILLTLSGLAQGGEVIVSRGELVEIGGGFRIPEVIAQGGARLVEVGATNRTRIADYRAAIGPDTRVLLKVHQSNFRIAGFAEETPIAALAGLAAEHGLLVVADLGSGLVSRLAGVAEPTLREAIAAGADLVTASGDKLLGGPQAGLLLGRAAAVDRLRRHPLMRALRLDKMSLAALAATLRLHRDDPGAVPVVRMLGQTEAVLAARAERLRALVGQGEVVASEGYAGGGSLPEQRLASRALALGVADPDALAARLRAATPAIVSRIAGGLLLIDLLAVADDEVEALAGALRAALG